jgi:fructan beta-fructosidase
VTFSNTGNRKIFLAWMNNWNYAQQVPTARWRGAMTVPRELALKEVEGIFFLTMQPVREFAMLEKPRQVLQGPSFNFGEEEFQLTSVNSRLESAQFRLDVSTVNVADFSVELANLAGDKVVVGYDTQSNEYFIDRRQSGNTTFSDGFAAVQRGARVSKHPTLQLTLIADVASVELFADGGLTCMTAIYFPNGPLNSVRLITRRPLSLNRVAFSEISSIW